MAWCYEYLIAAGCNADTASVVTGVVFVLLIYFPLRMFMGCFTRR